MAIRVNCNSSSGWFGRWFRSPPQTAILRRRTTPYSAMKAIWRFSLGGTLGLTLTITASSGRGAEKTSSGATGTQPGAITNGSAAPQFFPNELLRFAEECQKRGDYELAQRLCWKIIDSDTDLSNRLKAVAGLRKAAEASAARSDTSVTQLLELAKTYNDIGRYKDAEAVYA